MPHARRLKRLEAATVVWGVSLLIGLTWLVAESRGASVTVEIVKHLTVAALVIAMSRMVGMFISTYVD